MRRCAEERHRGGMPPPALAPPPREGGRPPPPLVGLEEQGKGRSSARHRRIRPPARHGPPRHHRWRRPHPRPCSTRLAWPRSTLPHLAVTRSSRRGSSAERHRCWPGADHERLPPLEEEQGSHGPVVAAVSTSPARDGRCTRRRGPLCSAPGRRTGAGRGKKQTAW
jgi:hypothetical protein